MHKGFLNRPLPQQLYSHRRDNAFLHRPVSALRKYLDLRPTSSANTPLFIFQDGTFLTRPALTRHLCSLFQSTAGNTPASFASHSFRIGAATTAAAAGLPDWQIQAMGRWTTDCYTRYIRIPPDTLANASAVLAGSNPATSA